MPNVLLGVTGSVAAIRAPALYSQLRAAGWSAKIVATRTATYFFDCAQIDPADPHEPRRNPEAVILDEDEWPGQERGRGWQRGEPVVHIELRRWADLLLVAPVDANTLGKFAAGLCDNCLTSVWRAWDPGRPIVLAPAMNTLMWQHPATQRQLRQIGRDAGSLPLAESLDAGDLIAAINRHCPLLQIVPPAVKTLACGDEGEGAMAEMADIIAVVRERLALFDSRRFIA